MKKLKAKKAGRKYRAFLYCLIISAAAFVACAFYPGLIPALGPFLGGLAGYFAIYCGGNVSNKYVTMNRKGSQDGSTQ